MSIYKKLSNARVSLQQIKMSKSGRNTYSGYSYFELSDFLPHINRIFDEHGLCGVISFSQEQAELVIFEHDGDGKIVFMSPVADATVKGCTPIQSLGSQQTYLRRYLWMMALEIVEHDAIDAVTTKDDAIPDYEQQLRTAVSLHDLSAKWQSVPKALQRKLTPVKDEMKLKLNEAA